MTPGERDAGPLEMCQLCNKELCLCGHSKPKRGQHEESNESAAEQRGYLRGLEECQEILKQMDPDPASMIWYEVQKMKIRATKKGGG
jgi:hypothetical protein